MQGRFFATLMRDLLRSVSSSLLGVMYPNTNPSAPSLAKISVSLSIAWKSASGGQKLASG